MHSMVSFLVPKPGRYATVGRSAVAGLPGEFHHHVEAVYGNTRILNSPTLECKLSK